MSEKMVSASAVLPRVKGVLPFLKLNVLAVTNGLGWSQLLFLDQTFHLLSLSSFTFFHFFHSLLVAPLCFVFHFLLGCFDFFCSHVGVLREVAAWVVVKGSQNGFLFEQFLFFLFTESLHIKTRLWLNCWWRFRWLSRRRFRSWIRVYGGLWIDRVSFWASFWRIYGHVWLYIRLSWSLACVLAGIWETLRGFRLSCGGIWDIRHMNSISWYILDVHGLISDLLAGFLS